jgi:aspartate/methionine/tyrosine aminotransferase
MEHPDYETQRAAARAILRERALEVRRILADHRYKQVWTPYPFNSGYFMCVKLKDLRAETFRSRLLEDYGVGVIATSETDIRIAFSCVEVEQLRDLFDTMYRCAMEMKSR